MLKKITNYLTEVKSEAKKVSWLSKKETVTTSISVFVIVSIFAVFFLLIDLLISNIINNILNI
jgi:preprotein translocase subunit SecE